MVPEKNQRILPASAEIIQLNPINHNLKKILKQNPCSFARYQILESLKIFGLEFPVVANLDTNNGYVLKNNEAIKTIHRILIDGQNHGGLF